MRGNGGVAGEGRVVGVPKFHSWGKCTIPLTNMNSDWMSNASSGLCIIYADPLFRILGCNFSLLKMLCITGHSVRNPLRRRKCPENRQRKRRHERLCRVSVVH